MAKLSQMRVMLWAMALVWGGVMWWGLPGALAQEANDAAAPATAATAPADEEATTTDATAPAGEDAAATDEGDQPKTALELWTERLKTTGTTGVFLFALSVFGLAFILERLVRLRRDAVVPAGFAARVDEMWHDKQYAQIQSACEQHDSVMGRVVNEVVRHRHLGATEVSAMAGDVASRELRKQQNKAYPIAVVAGLAPLLGLMGTVIGMVGAFETVAAVGSMGDPSVLADDISKALLTTAWGLAIAIPTLAMYHFFKTRTNQFGLLLEEQVSELISEWFHPTPKGGDDEAGAGAGVK